jgi:hypothetical protein
MTTEKHAWASAHVRSEQTWRSTAPVCGCGQDLDVCTGSHCPRCGTLLAAHAA